MFKALDRLRTTELLRVSIEPASPGLVRELLQLTPLDAGAFFIASPELCEVYTSKGTRGALLRGLLAERLKSDASVVGWHDRPLTAGSFFEGKHRFASFAALHQRLFGGLQRGTLLEAARLVAQSRPFTALNSTLSDHVRAGLLGHSRVHVPPLSQGQLTRRYGAARTSDALLLVKLLHNFYVTARTLGLPVVPEAESDWYDAALAP
jgi:hypothetical protein